MLPEKKVKNSKEGKTNSEVRFTKKVNSEQVTKKEQSF
jgi:hypothetical protein